MSNGLINEHQPLENLFAVTYARLFDSYAQGSAEERKVSLIQMMSIGVIEHSLTAERDHLGEFSGKAERSWPNTINTRLDSHIATLDIVPSRLQMLGESILNIDSEVIKALPVTIFGSKAYNLLPSGATDVEFVEMAVSEICPTTQDTKLSEVA